MHTTIALLVALTLIGCDSPTAPHTQHIFPYSGCQVQAGVTYSDPRNPPEHLIDVWQDWRCSDGAHWQVDHNGTVIRVTP